MSFWRLEGCGRGVGWDFAFEIGSESEPHSKPFRKLAPFRSLKSKNNANFWSVASKLMPQKSFSPKPYIFRFLVIYHLREEFFPVTPVKTVLPIPKLVRGLKKTSARLNFSPFSWPTTWGTNFSGDTHKIDPSHSSLSEGIYWKMAITRKFFLQALIFHRSRDLPLERERVFSGTPKNTHLNLLASEGVPQEHPIPSPEKEVMHQPTTE